MKLYIAYGSNLNVGQMARRCPDATIAGVAVLPNYKLTFRGNSHTGVANVEPSKGHAVPIGLWWISDRDERALDIYEGYPHLYTKVDFPVKIHGQHEVAMAYIMTGHRAAAAPSTGYLHTIAEGYDYFGFDVEQLFKTAKRYSR